MKVTQVGISSLCENWPLFVTFICAAIMVMPIWGVDSPGMVDYPSHLASYYLIAGGTRDPLLAHYYLIRWQAIPNIGFEVLVPALAWALSPPVATKLLLSAAVGLWVIAPALIRRALFGRFGVEPLGAAFFAYNDNYMLGFLNYYLAAGLALLFFAIWVRCKTWRQWSRIVAFAPAVLAIYFCHIVGAVALLLLIFLYECSVLLEETGRKARVAFERIWPVSVIALPALLFFLFLKPQGEDGRITFDVIATLRQRVQSTVDIAFNEHNYFIILILGALLTMGFWWRLLRVQRHMTVVLAGILVVSVLAPDTALGGTGVAERLPPMLGSLAFASIATSLSPTTNMFFAVSTLLATVINALLLQANWSHYDLQYREFRAALQQLPRGLRLLTVRDAEAIGKNSELPYIHMAEFGVIDRADFSPLLFMTKGQSIVHLQPQMGNVGATSAREGLPPDLSVLQSLSTSSDRRDSSYLSGFKCKFDEAVVIRMSGVPSPAPPVLKIRYSGSFFSLYDIDHAGCKGVR